MTRQLELFAPAKPPRLTSDERDKRKLVRVLRSAAKGGLVNGMSKAAMRRYYPKELPKVTLP